MMNEEIYNTCPWIIPEISDRNLGTGVKPERHIKKNGLKAVTATQILAEGWYSSLTY